MRPCVVLSAEFGPASWALDPAFASPTPNATELHILVWERTCSGGSPHDRADVGSGHRNGPRRGHDHDRRAGTRRRPDVPRTARDARPGPTPRASWQADPSRWWARATHPTFADVLTRRTTLRATLRRLTFGRYGRPARCAELEGRRDAMADRVDDAGDRAPRRRLRHDRAVGLAVLGSISGRPRPRRRRRRPRHRPRRPRRSRSR